MPTVLIRFEVDDERVETIEEATQEILDRLHHDLTGGYGFEAVAEEENDVRRER